MYLKKKVDKGTASRSLYCMGSNKLLAFQQGERVRGLVRWGRVAGFLFFEVCTFRDLSVMGRNTSLVGFVTLSVMK